MKIAVLGTGRFATDLAPALADAGHSVTFGSRTPRDRGELPGEIVSVSEAVSGAELVVNALPGLVALELLPTFGAELQGRVLLDASNAFDDEGGLVFPNSSVGERLQEVLPGVHVVKALSNMAGYVAADPASLAGATTAFLAGDDDTAKLLVRSVLESIGWSDESHIDLGGITAARAIEHTGLLFWALVAKYRTGEFNLAVVRTPGAS
ncbi:NADPH-dependent F420 reductase [Curtobacterium pusillum]|uniref:NADPH-dependent F420 reductase n=1 Tax=Curtobacterium pusillum TaxID=69373 RepID=UPI0011A470C0|nr:NAD(P)-binding domain-containing protein [Curtobacterium pusillum]